jgi:hypothetical protein
VHGRGQQLALVCVTIVTINTIATAMPTPTRHHHHAIIPTSSFDHIFIPT